MLIILIKTTVLLQEINGRPQSTVVSDSVITHCMFTHTYTHTYTHTHTYIYIYIYIYGYVCVCAYTCMYICVCV